MRIEHVALWTDNLERLTHFYATYFGAAIDPKYTNQAAGFESHFLKFDNGARIEVMRMTFLSPIHPEPGALRIGFTHLAISVGSEKQVDFLTQRLRNDGYPVIDNPHRTGDGYYESVILDPDGNRIEITI